MNQVDRSPTDRRSGKDRRKKIRFQHLLHKDQEVDTERRIGNERRTPEERRDGWVRIGKWVGVCLEKLKIAKYLR